MKRQFKLLTSLSFLALLIAFSHSASAQYDYALDRYMRDQNVQVIKLSKNGSSYGYGVFLLRGKSNSKLKAKYFAKNAYSEFLRWKSGKDIVLISSGAYSTGWDASSDTPVGLCVDNGATVNRNIKTDMDGLVIVEKVGGVRVSDIDQNNLYLQSIGRTISPISEKNTLIQWGQDQEATIFQTHLLAYEKQLRISPSNSNKESANRRLLVLGYTSDGALFHAIFHIDRKVSLYDATNDTMKSLEVRGINVVSVLNLDTGGYDILEVYDDRNKQVSYIQGRENKSKATNLLIYYYD